MPKPRCSGRRRSIRVSSSQMLPAVEARSPAMQFSVVDFPQPEGPRRATNSPFRIVTEIDRTRFVVGKSVSGRVGLGGRRIINKKRIDLQVHVNTYRRY